MKALLALSLLVLASQSFANLPRQSCSGSQLQKYLPVGSYSGSTDNGVSCQVSVNQLKDGIEVSVVAGNSSAKKVITNDSYGICVGSDSRKEFIQDDRVYNADMDDSTFNEDVIRTLIVGDDRLYVVVSNEEVILGDQNSYQSAECVIKP